MLFTKINDDDDDDDDPVETTHGMVMSIGNLLRFKYLFKILNLVTT